MWHYSSSSCDEWQYSNRSIIEIKTSIYTLIRLFRISKLICSKCMGEYIRIKDIWFDLINNLLSVYLVWELCEALGLVHENKIWMGTFVVIILSLSQHIQYWCMHALKVVLPTLPSYSSFPFIVSLFSFFFFFEKKRKLSLLLERISLSD